jgi:hypothetical protein
MSIHVHHSRSTAVATCGSQVPLTCVEYFHYVGWSRLAIAQVSGDSLERA